MIRPLALILLSFVFGLYMSSCGQTASNESRPPVAQSGSVPQELAKGETLFMNHCARCHGEKGAGTNQGPPLVHKIYEPNHHGDASFLRAVQMGVRAHHWSFGDMPPVPGVTQEDVAEIVRYVRYLQRQAGIF